MINSPQAFKEAAPAQFDGQFNWDFLKGAFGGKIMPMDWDGVVERKGNFLVFETKHPGKEIPNGQRFTFEAAHRTGLFTFFFIWGATDPEQLEIWKPTEKIPVVPTTTESVFALAKEWYDTVNTNPPATITKDKASELLAEIQQHKHSQQNTVSRFESVGWRGEDLSLVQWFITADLPRDPFQLAPWRKINDPTGFYAALMRDLTDGPEGCRAKYRSIQKDLEMLAAYTQKERIAA